MEPAADWSVVQRWLIGTKTFGMVCVLAGINVSERGASVHVDEYTQTRMEKPMANQGRKSRGEGEASEAGAACPEAHGGGCGKALRADNGNAVADPALEPPIDQYIQKHLGRKLKASYDDLVRQPVPDKFRQLLDDCRYFLPE